MFGSGEWLVIGFQWKTTTGKRHRRELTKNRVCGGFRCRAYLQINANILWIFLSVEIVFKTQTEYYRISEQWVSQQGYWMWVFAEFKRGAVTDFEHVDACRHLYHNSTFSETFQTFSLHTFDKFKDRWVRISGEDMCDMSDFFFFKEQEMGIKGHFCKIALTAN